MSSHTISKHVATAGGHGVFSRPLYRALAYAFYVLSTLQVASFYVMSTREYLNYKDYFSGHERLPFQERILPALFLWPILHFRPALSAFARLGGVFMPVERGAFFVLSLISLSLAGYFTLKLYRAVSVHRELSFLVYPAFLYVCLWSYVVLVQMNFSYPYDWLSLAFFTAGIYFIYRDRFAALFFVVLLGTFNRETTLFLIGLYILDRASVERANTGESMLRRFDLHQIPWLRVVLLALTWTAVKMSLHQRFAGNDASENYLRIHENLHLLTPKHWPALLNICGYLLPIVFIFRRYLVPQRFANYLYILPVWIAVMACAGILIETRIYGELSGFTAVAVVLLIERYVRGAREA